MFHLLQSALKLGFLPAVPSLPSSTCFSSDDPETTELGPVSVVHLLLRFLLDLLDSVDCDCSEYRLLPPVSWRLRRLLLPSVELAEVGMPVADGVFACDEALAKEKRAVVSFAGCCAARSIGSILLSSSMASPSDMSSGVSILGFFDLVLFESFLS